MEFKHFICKFVKAIFQENSYLIIHVGVDNAVSKCNETQVIEVLVKGSMLTTFRNPDPGHLAASPPRPDTSAPCIPFPPGEGRRVNRKEDVKEGRRERGRTEAGNDGGSGMKCGLERTG